MCDIAELTTLFRGRVELPDHLAVVMEDFQEGWSSVQSGDSVWMDNAIRTNGWHFIWIAEGSQRSGVGQTAQEAVASALKLALRQVSKRYNAAAVDYIELKQYPWFFLAKVRISPYQIQKNPILSPAVTALTAAIPPPAEAVVPRITHPAPAA